MEYLLVSFREERDVLIDGVVAGVSNQLITMAAGQYTVTLAPPLDFTPAERTVVVRDTSPLDPMEVAFG